MHFHKLKLETMYLAKGKMLIRTDSGDIPLSVGEKIQIPREQKHQLVAIEDSELYEFSTQHFEWDSYRINPSPDRLPDSTPSLSPKPAHKEPESPA